jgi:hypothetical protein
MSNHLHASEDIEASRTYEEKVANNDGYDTDKIGLDKDKSNDTITPVPVCDDQTSEGNNAVVPRDDSDAESIGGQRNAMSTKRLMVAIPALSVCLFVSFVDQTSVSTATPAIAGDLSTGTATSWIGTSFLIASTAFQLINGRLSDIFGRKNLLLICLALMGLGDLGCGFAQTADQFFALRSIAGIGGGGINSLVMIIVSDITTLQNRGKYQGTVSNLSVANRCILICDCRLAGCYHCSRQWSRTIPRRRYRRRCDLEMGVLDDTYHDAPHCGCHIVLLAAEAPIRRSP